MSITIALCPDMMTTRRFVPDRVGAFLAGADLSVGNFEMPLTDRGFPVEKLLNVRATADIAEDVAGIGFDVVTLANNHAVDYGWDGLADTAQALRSFGLTTVGSGLDRSVASQPAFFTRDQWRVGVMGFSCLTPANMSATDTRPGIAAVHVATAYEIDPLYQAEEPGDPSVVRIRTETNKADLAFILTAVSKAKSECDVLVVSLHWGFGSGEALAEYQRPLAEALLDAGADVIHGHHPHAIHPIGFHDGKPIIFGGGTFIGQQVFLPASDQVHKMWSEMSPDGLIAHVTFDKERPPSIQLVPVTLDADRLPIPAVDGVFERIAARLQRLSADQGADIMISEGRLDARPSR